MTWISRSRCGATATRRIAKVEALPIDIRLNTKVTAELVRETGADAIICAVGSEPVVLPVPGAEGANVLQAALLRDDTPVGRTVVVMGGGLVGVEEAVTLGRRGHRVTIVEMLPEILADCWKLTKLSLLHELARLENVSVETGMRVTRITEEGVFAQASGEADGAERFFSADTVVSAAGMRARSADVEALRPLAREFYVIGDAFRARKIRHAVTEAYDAVVSLGML